MNDQIPGDLTRAEARAVREWAERSLTLWDPNVPVSKAARVVLAVLPKRPTLADMTPEERDECRGMQADLAQGDRVVILDGHPGLDGRALVLESSLDTFRPTPQEVTPRPDLARLTWPAGDQGPEPEPAPAPALPDGWRLADHPRHGRVIVTNTTPNSDGHVYFTAPAVGRMGYGCDWCDPAELTFLDQGADQ